MRVGPSACVAVGDGARRATAGAREAAKQPPRTRKTKTRAPPSPIAAVEEKETVAVDVGGGGRLGNRRRRSLRYDDDISDVAGETAARLVGRV